MSQLQGNHGGALLITMGLMLMLTIAAIMAVQTAQTDIDLSFNQLNGDLAFYVAEAGLKKAFVDLNQNNALDTVYANISFESGFYSTIIIHGDTAHPMYDTVTIKSAGSVQDANANITALAVPELIYPFQFAMFGEDGVTMDNSTNTDSYNSDLGTFDATLDTLAGGDVASNGTITLDGSADVAGNVSTSTVGGISVCATCTVTGIEDDSFDHYDLDEIPREDFDDAALNNDNASITGDYTPTAPWPSIELGIADTAYLHTGIYYFVNITLQMNSCLKVAPGDSAIIYLDGTLTLENNTSVNPDGNPADCLIFSDGQIVAVGENTELSIAFYGPDADVTLGQSCEWFGSIIAESIDASNTGTVHYDLALGKLAYGTTGKMLMIAWQEN